MKNLCKSLIIIGGFLGAFGLRATTCAREACDQCASTIYIPRPQYLNSPVFFNPYYYPCDQAELDHYASITLGYRYEQTWHGSRIAECLFGDDTLYFAGTQQTNREPGKTYVQAENFGLSPLFIGKITFDPRIQNNIIDFSARCELDHWIACLRNVYVMFNASLVHTNWDLRACQETLNTAQNPDNFILPQCLHGTNQEGSLHTIFQALSGEFSFGQLNQGPMPFGRFVLDKAQKKTALANIDMIAGYDVCRCDGYHCGLFLKAVAPTGNRPNVETVFSPIVGNGHHWEFGGGLDAHYDFLEYGNACWSVALTGAITHLFRDRQTRTFGINADGACCLSQYSLLKEYFARTNDSDASEGAGQTFYVPAGKLDWGTTFSTVDVQSSFSMQGDAAIQLLYRNNGWAFGLGYNVYGRTAEKIDQIEEHCDRMNRLYGIKGKTGVCALSNSGLCQFDPASGTTTNMQATNTANCVSASTTAPVTVDNPSANITCTGWNGQNPIQNSTKPVILDVRKNINFVGAPTQISHKIFCHMNYQWDGDSKPFIGIGGECEFAQQGSCHVCTASQWGLWIKGGLEF